MQERPQVQEAKQELKNKIENIKEDVDFQKTLLKEANATLKGEAREKAVEELLIWGLAIRLNILEVKQDIRKILPIEEWNKPEQLLDGLMVKTMVPERPDRNRISYFKEKKGE
ncbi:MAG: hypothetical protein Q7R79_05450 [bacterium]|nr:hypothetical protein [bacterium]